MTGPQHTEGTLVRGRTMPDRDLHERISRRAYLLWEQEGRPEGRAQAHWLQAEAEAAGVNPGEEASPGMPGAGEHVCPACEGTGRLGRRRCKDCGGTGRIVDVPAVRSVETS